MISSRERYNDSFAWCIINALLIPFKNNFFDKLVISFLFNFFFELIFKASKYGAKVALFGRKINLSEDPIGLVQLMRKVVERDTTPEEAVKIYHDQLIKKKLTPDRNLKYDLRITDPILKL